MKMARTDPELPMAEMYTNIYSQIPAELQIRNCESEFVKATNS